MEDLLGDVYVVSSVPPSSVSEAEKVAEEIAKYRKDTSIPLLASPLKSSLSQTCNFHFKGLVKWPGVLLYPLWITRCIHFQTPLIQTPLLQNFPPVLHTRSIYKL